MVKKCKLCLLEKDISYFNKIGSLHCKECSKILRKASVKKYNDSHLLQRRSYYNKNREILVEKSIVYNKNNRQTVNKASNNRRKNPSTKLRNNISTLVRFHIKKNQGSKSKKSILDVLPYSIQDLKDYLESKFEPWMTWENHGIYNSKIWDDNNQNTWTWQIDHIIPQSILPYTDMTDENFKKCWALENLRPYNAKQNILDGTLKIRHEQR